ncbi:MAG TPA: hypothetical protein RMH99_00190, partial [Sandaracinaceae bacterium LLY-WYZ-13_1]|nr:hypothetical protein [Sandaracinaceae bacterium LLY-WYZ-13_1]
MVSHRFLRGSGDPTQPGRAAYTPWAALLALAVATGALGCDLLGGGEGEASAQPSATERVTLRATHPDGVPLHPGEHDRHVSGRLPDGVAVAVVRWGEGRRWLEVRAPDGRQGWIVARYVPSSTFRLAGRLVS